MMRWHLQLCNKCGLFERTHSRPRPEQFPHKRGPLASSSLRHSPQSSAQFLPVPSPSHRPAISPPYQHHSSPLAASSDSRRGYLSTVLPENPSRVNETTSGGPL